jgi:putative ABC transport system permease protein
VIPAAQRTIYEATGRPAGPLAAATDGLRERLFAQRVSAIAFQVFSAFGLLLAAMGIYGIAAYAVTQRMREIGIRLALGAPRAAVVALIARNGVLLAVSGALLGLIGALALARVYGSIMVGTSPMNAWIYLGAAIVMVVTALAATLMPARRAAQTDAMSVLRAE